MKDATITREPLLLTQLRWITGLRWLAGGVVLAGSVADSLWLGWYKHDGYMAALGAAILVYNAALRGMLRRLPRERLRRRRWLVRLAETQILLDMACLTALNLSTGGLNSPLRGFFVFHMVFASLMLRRRMAYGLALVALLMLSAGLALCDPTFATRESALLLLGWWLMLVVSVYLTSHVTQSLREHRRRLLGQNRRVSAMGRRLRRQQKIMLQHEKMVALGQMAAGVAHEIANPLASMDSLLQLTQRNPDRLRPEMVVTLREQLARIHQIVRQMRNFAHPSEGLRQTLPVNQIAEQAFQMIRFDPRLKGVQIDKYFAPDAGTVHVQPQAVEQVLLNLVINALDAVAGVASPRVTIRTVHARDECIIEVQDNGVGIQPEHMSRLFEPFFTTKPVGKGTGLGLSISYSLIRNQDGRIEVHSHPGHGATFRIHLPVGNSASSSREKPTHSAPISEKN